MSQRRSKHESAWIPLQALADALDISVDHLRKNILRQIPADCQRRDRSKIMVYGRGAIEAWLGARVQPTEKCTGCEARDRTIGLLLNPDDLIDLLSSCK